MGLASSSQLEDYHTVPTLCSCEETFSLWFSCSTKMDSQSCVFCPSINMWDSRDWLTGVPAQQVPQERASASLLRLHLVSASWGSRATPLVKSRLITEHRCGEVQPLPVKQYTRAPFMADLTTDTQQLFSPNFTRRIFQTLTKSKGWEGHLQNAWFALAQFV